MADYDVEAFIQKRNANKNTMTNSANAGKQAADSMRSVGISSISGKTTTSAAQRIQEQFKKNRERRRNERGLGGSPVVKEEPPMSSYERLKNMVSNLFSFSGGKLVGGTKETDPSKLYSRSSFVIPAAVAVTATELPPAAVAEQSPYTSPYMRPQSSNRDQSPTSYRFAGARDPYMERRGSPGLMAPPTMDQPDTPGMPDAINRAIASIGAEETADYTIQSGDTLSEIAAATGTTVKELQELNGIKNANRIEAGKDISIPIRRAEDKEVVTKATSMEELKPIKANYVADSTDPDSQYYNSFNQEVGSSVEDFIVNLTGSESSGNPDAEVTLDDGRRFVGLLQFGKARLKDYKDDTKTKFTQDEFKKDLSLQNDVAIWHIKDIDKTIDSVIDKSMFKNRDGLRAVAHLGGKTGMKKFVESNGAYNPKDKFGTRLSDYYEKFSK
jgi:LysM repeat protein